MDAAMKRYDEDLSRMNRGKVGAPYEYTDMLIIAGFAIKSVFKLGYREATGNVKDYAEAMHMVAPDFRTVHWRVSRMQRAGIKLMVYQKGGRNVDVIVDASGVKSVNDGEYRSAKYGKVKRWKKIHIAVDGTTHKILNIIVTENDIVDVEEFVRLMTPIREMNGVRTATGDGGYDSERNFGFCDRNGIEPIIPLHVNATGSCSKHRRKRVTEQLGVDIRSGRRPHRVPLLEERRQNQDRWKDSSGYHRRSLVETAFSVFKGAFGEYTFSRRDDMKEKELLLKAVVYNNFLV